MLFFRFLSVTDFFHRILAFLVITIVLCLIGILAYTVRQRANPFKCKNIKEILIGLLPWLVTLWSFCFFSITVGFLISAIFNWVFVVQTKSEFPFGDWVQPYILLFVLYACLLLSRCRISDLCYYLDSYIFVILVWMSIMRIWSVVDSETALIRLGTGEGENFAIKILFCVFYFAVTTYYVLITR